MKFILLNVNETNKNIINTRQLDNIHYINEVSLSKKILNKMNKKPSGIIQKFKYMLGDKDIENKILKALDLYDKKWYYILNQNLVNDKYLLNKIQALLGYKLTSTNELDTNIFKHIDGYLTQNNKLKKHELNVLLVVKYNSNLNLTLVENLIKEYKRVSIYLNEKPSYFILKKIKQINTEEGTTIDIIKNERKAFKEFDVIYFVDDLKENYPRFRLNKNSYIVDLSLKDKDEFNTNLIFMNEYLANENVFKDNIETLKKSYNNLELACAINKIVKDLDKS